MTYLALALALCLAALAWMRFRVRRHERSQLEYLTRVVDREGFNVGDE